MPGVDGPVSTDIKMGLVLRNDQILVYCRDTTYKIPLGYRKIIKLEQYIAIHIFCALDRELFLMIDRNHFRGPAWG